MREFGEILGKYRILDGRYHGSIGLMSDLLETVGDEDPGLVDAQVGKGVTEGRHIPGSEGTRLVHRTAVLPGVKQHRHLGARNHRQVHLVEVYNENSDSQ